MWKYLHSIILTKCRRRRRNIEQENLIWIFRISRRNWWKRLLICLFVNNSGQVFSNFKYFWQSIIIVIIILNFETKKMFSIEFSYPSKRNISMKEEEERSKYLYLLSKLRKLYPDFKVKLAVLYVGVNLRTTLVNMLAGDIFVCNRLCRDFHQFLCLSFCNVNNIWVRTYP